MGTKRFRTSRRWHNTLIMVWGYPFLVLPGIIVGASSGRFRLLQVMALLGLLGILAALRRDRKRSGVYSIEGDRLILQVNADERRIDLEEVNDASLIDRMGARAYLKDRGRGGQPESASVDHAQADAFTRYCTLDIGLHSYTLGLARNVIDRLPSAKDDLVLLRLRGGEDLLLSPIHAQAMVDSLARRKMLARS